MRNGGVPMTHNIINQVRQNIPLIHHITNDVVMNFTANGLLAFGGSPIMAKEEKEAGAITELTDGLLLNIGTIQQPEVAAMFSSGKTANDKGIPIVLDPVGVAASSFRAEAVQMILKQVQPTVIKGNAGEIAFLADVSWDTKGVDAVGNGNTEEIAYLVAKKYQTAVVVTGETDVFVVDGNLFTNQTGHPLLTKITGAGCLLGSIMAACLSTDFSIEKQLLAALEFYGGAAAYAAAQPHTKGPGTFLPAFLDALSFNWETIKGDTSWTN